MKPKITENDIKKIVFDNLKNVKLVSIGEINSTKTKVTLYCEKHGEFECRLDRIKEGKCCCPICRKEKDIQDSFNEFVKKANKKFNGRYVYLKDSFTSINGKINFICPIHGIQTQRASNHLIFNGCPKCSKSGRIPISFENMEERANNVHNFNFKYVKESYRNFNKKMKIICPVHGEFEMTPNKHINQGKGCPICGLLSRKTIFNTNDFIEKAKNIHGDDYDYSNTHYVDTKTKVCIICKKCGREFWQEPLLHLYGQGCRKCAYEKTAQKRTRINTDTVISLSQNKFGIDEIDYSKTEYTGTKNKICFICHKKDKNGKEHGEFWQRIDTHLKGCGCPKCCKSHLEIITEDVLTKLAISYKREYTFNWLVNKKHLKLDFYLPDYNIAIECQGKQHFEPVSFGMKDKEKINEEFQENIERDRIKKKLCNENGIKVIYVNYWQNDEEITFLLRNLLI
jgi:hypothetical protein